jgi:hypothetical protein
MTGITTQLIYVESAGDEESAEAFAWYGGTTLTAAQHDERAQIHRELTDIVKRAESDQTADWGRTVRCGDRLLVEVGVTPMTGTANHLTATIVVSGTSQDTEWARETAEEVAAILRDNELDITAERLAQAFAEGWSRKNFFGMRRLPQALAAVSAAIAVVFWWLRSGGRTRHRRQAGAPKPGNQR